MYRTPEKRHDGLLVLAEVLGISQDEITWYDQWGSFPVIEIVPGGHRWRLFHVRENRDWRDGKRIVEYLADRNIWEIADAAGISLRQRFHDTWLIEI